MIQSDLQMFNKNHDEYYMAHTDFQKNNNLPHSLYCD